MEAERRAGQGQDVDVTWFPTDEEVVIQRDSVSRSRFEFERVFKPGTASLPASLPVSITVSLTVSLPHLLPHCLTDCLTVSLTASLSH